MLIDEQPEAEALSKMRPRPEEQTLTACPTTVAASLALAGHLQLRAEACCWRDQVPRPRQYQRCSL